MYLICHYSEIWSPCPLHMHKYNGAVNQDMLRLGRSLQKWPLPRLRRLEMAGRYFCRVPYEQDPAGFVYLNECWQQIGLPEEANAWSNEQILDYFRAQQKKIEAFIEWLSSASRGRIALVSPA